MLSDLKIQGIEAKPGEKKSGQLSLYDGSEHVADLVLGIVYGSKPGPTLCLTAGLNGELTYPATEAIVRTFKTLDPVKLSGVILAVLRVNVRPHNSQSKKSAINDSTLTDGFQGSICKATSGIIARFLLNEVVAKSGFHVDLRSGNADEMVINYTVFCKTSNRLNEIKANLANAYGTEAVLLSTTSDLGEDGKLIEQTSKLNVASIIASVGIGMGRRDEKDVSMHMSGIRNAMMYLEMLDGTLPHRFDKPQLELQPVHAVKTVNQGLFHPRTKCGDVVSNGELVGCIENSSGKTIEELCAPVDGIVHSISTKKTIRTGEKLVTIYCLFEKWIDRYVEEWMDRFLED